METLEPKRLLTATAIEVAPTILDQSQYIAEVDTIAEQESFVRDYLAQNDETQYLQQGDSDVRLAEVKYGLAGIYNRFLQTYEGIDIFDSWVTVNQGPDGTVQQLFHGGHDKIRTTDYQINGFDQMTAERAALRNIGSNTTFAKSNVDLVWYVDEQGDATLAWQLMIYSSAPLGDYLTLVDAETNEVIMQENHSAHATGNGDVFEPNPWQTQGSGAGLSDNNDATSSALEAQHIDVTLLGLNDGTGLLQGEFVDLATLNSPSLPDVDANEPTRDYYYDRDDPRFEQVVIYHAVDSLNRYFHSLGFDDHSGATANGIRDFATLANAHWFTADQSFYSSANDAIHFGDGGVDDGEDADIIAHEYGHAVQHNQNAAWGGGEMGAMGEGFGDYLAASFYANNGDTGYQLANAPCVGEWDATSYSGTSPPCLRRVDGDKTYPDDLGGGVHADGEIWSAALWDIRTVLGGPITDQLVLESHFALPGGATMPIAAEAILTADLNLNGGTNQAAIRQEFVDRGILEPLPDTGVVTFNRDTYNESDTITITVVDANVGSSTLDVSLTSDSGDFETVVLTDQGGFTYTATIDTSNAAVATEDGVLQVTLGDEIVVTYMDADTGGGTPGTVIDTATIANVTKYDATGLPIVVEAGPHLSTITVADGGLVADLNIVLDITHTYAADLDVFLIAPDGTRVELFTDVGGSGNNFTNTVLDDEATSTINSGSAPFTGTFSPEGDLSDFDGVTVTGDWTLEITDDFPFDVDSGTLNSWSLCVELVPDPSLGNVEVTGPVAAADETDGTNVDVTFTITLDQPSLDPVSVDYQTVDGTALAGFDYVTTSGVAVFNFGQTVFTVTVPVIGDYLTEDSEQFSLELSDPVGANVTNGVATADINDNEVFSQNTLIDFGTQISPVATTSIGITDLEYDAGRGFGWAPGATGLQIVDRGTGTDTQRDIALFQDATFLADVSTGAGTYDVLIEFGDNDFARETFVNIGGQNLGSVATAAGEFVTQTFRVKVTGPQVAIALTEGTDGAAITSLSVKQANEWLFDFGTPNSPVVAPGYFLADNTVYTPATNSYGWSDSDTKYLDYPNISDPLLRDIGVIYDNLFSAELPDGMYDATIVLGDYDEPQIDIAVIMMEEPVDFVDTVPGEFHTGNYQIEVTDGLFTMRVKGSGLFVSPFAYISSLVLTPMTGKGILPGSGTAIDGDKITDAAREMLKPAEGDCFGTASPDEMCDTQLVDPLSTSQLTGFDSAKLAGSSVRRFTAQDKAFARMFESGATADFKPASGALDQSFSELGELVALDR